MTNEKRLETAIRAMRLNWTNEDGLQRPVDEALNDPTGMLGFPFLSESNRALLELYADALESLGKQKTGSAALSAMKRILKSAGDRLAGASKQDEMWMLCDGYRGYILNAKPDIIPAASDVQNETRKGLYDLLMRTRDLATVEVTAPKLADVKKYLADEKVKRNARKTDRIEYNIPGSKTWVNAEFLIDLPTVFPDAKMYVNENPLQGIAVIPNAETGELGILMPVRHVEEIAA